MNNRLLGNNSWNFCSRSHRRLSCYYYHSLLTCILHIRCIGCCKPLSAAIIITSMYVPYEIKSQSYQTAKARTLCVRICAGPCMKSLQYCHLYLFYVLSGSEFDWLEMMKTLSNDLLDATFPYWLSMKLLYEDGQNDEHVVIKAAGQLSRITQFIKCHSRVNVELCHHTGCSMNIVNW